MSSILNNQKDSKRIFKKFSLAVFIMLACLFMTSSSTELKNTHKKQPKIGGRRRHFNADSKENQIVPGNSDEIPEVNPTATGNVEGEVTNDSTNTMDAKFKNQVKLNLKNFIGNHIKRFKNKNKEEGSHHKVHSIPEPTVETVPQPTGKTVPQPTVETVPKPTAETVIHPTAETVIHPTAGTVTEHIPNPTDETVSQPTVPLVTSEKIINPTAETVAQQIPNPTAEKVPQPTSGNVTGTIHLTLTQPEPVNQSEPAPESTAATTFLETKKTKVQLKSKLESRLSSKQATDAQPAAAENQGPATVNNNNNNNIYNNKSSQPFAVQLQDPKDPYAYANTKQKCTQINCPYPSICVAEYVCKCEPSKANFSQDPLAQENPSYYCIYERKKQLIAFLLEFFLPPFGHFYAGQYIIASLKLVLPCLFLYLFVKVENTLAKGIGGAGVCGLAIWWLVDIILYGTNYYSDQNKVRLAGW